MSFLRAVARTSTLPRLALAPRTTSLLSQRARFSAAAGLSRDVIQARVFDVLKGFEKVDPTKLTPAANFAKDLGLDSLDAVEVVMAVEEEFSIEIPDAEADEIQTVQQAIDYIAKTPEEVTDHMVPGFFDASYISRVRDFVHSTYLFALMSPTQITVDQPWYKIGCTLGEGPLYDPATGILHFVDIVEKKVFHLDIRDLSVIVEQFDEPISCLALREHGPGLACAAHKGYALLEGASSLRYINQPLVPEDVPHIRFNDGGCDSKGRFFAGTIYSNSYDIPGKLYKYDPQDDSTVVVDEGPFTDSNGLGWNPEETTFYFTDSLVNIIYAYDYVDGELFNRRVFADTLALGYPENSFPDGLCVDDEGGVWSARWGGSKLIRFTREGIVDFEVNFSTALNITACCFGGPDNDQLYVTTAHCGAIGGDASRQKEWPDSGHLFVVDLKGKYRGTKRYNFAG